jgi:hypothetical protein
MKHTFFVGFNGASQFGSVGGDGALHGTQIVSMNNVSNFEVINSINYSTNTGNAGTGMLNGNFVMSKKILGYWKYTIKFLFYWNKYK